MKNSNEICMCIPAAICLICEIYNCFTENNYNDIISAISYFCIALVFIQLIRYKKIYIILTIMFLLLAVCFLLKYLILN